MAFGKLKDSQSATISELHQTRELTPEEKNLVGWYTYGDGFALGEYFRAQGLDVGYEIEKIEEWNKTRGAFAFSEDFIGGLIDSEDQRNAYAEYDNLDIQ